MNIRSIGRYDQRSRLFRLTRITWERGTVGDGQGYAARLTIGLRPSLFAWRREPDGWRLILACVRLRYRRSYDGRFA